MKYTKIVNLLEAMLNQEMGIEVTQATLEKVLTSEIEEIFSNLDHYFSDEDIREKDIEYKVFQDNELKKLIHYLKVDNLEEANKISFLEVT